MLLVFATPLGDTIVLDCLPAASADEKPGAPFTLRALLTCSAEWVQAAIESTLSRWADRGCPVELVVLDGAVGREVRLSDGEARVQLPLATRRRLDA